MPIGLNQVVDRGINTALTRRLGLTPDATVSLMPELAPTLNIGPVPEMDYHLGWRKYMTAGTQAAQAVQFATFRFRLPRPGAAGAQVVCVIESVFMAQTGSVVAVQVKVAGIISAADEAILLGAQNRDTLQPATLPGTTQVSRGTDVDQGIGAGGLYNTFATVPGLFPLVMRPSLIPGVALDGYQFQFPTANTSVDFCLVWRERVLNDQENVP